MSMMKAIFSSLFIATVILFCVASALYLLSMLFMIIWNEGPAFVFSWPKINDWWRAGLILLCAWTLFPKIPAVKKDK